VLLIFLSIALDQVGLAGAAIVWRR